MERSSGGVGLPSKDGQGGMDGYRPFIIYSLPRSRSFWLSRFLTYGPWTCSHDQIKFGRSLEDLVNWFSQPNVGSCETAAAPFWRLAPSFTQVVTIRRSIWDVEDSFARTGLDFNPERLRKYLTKLDAKLDQIEYRVPGVIRINYTELDDESTCRFLFEKLLALPFDQSWYASLASINLQTNLINDLKYMYAHAGQLDKFAKLAKQRILENFGTKSADGGEGVSLSECSFDDWLDSCPGLFDSHLALVGEKPGNWENKNLPVMRRLYEANAMQILIARSNHGPVGYLMTLVSPSLEYPNALSAMHTTMFVKPGHPRLGQKMRKVAESILATKGCVEVFTRAGPRGDGPRLGKVYLREGMENQGQVFRKNLVGLV